MKAGQSEHLALCAVRQRGSWATPSRLRAFRESASRPNAPGSCQRSGWAVAQARGEPHCPWRPLRPRRVARRSRLQQQRTCDPARQDVATRRPGGRPSSAPPLARRVLNAPAVVLEALCDSFGRFGSYRGVTGQDSSAKPRRAQTPDRRGAVSQVRGLRRRFDGREPGHVVPGLLVVRVASPPEHCGMAAPAARRRRARGVGGARATYGPARFR